MTSTLPPSPDVLPDISPVPSYSTEPKSGQVNIAGSPLAKTSHREDEKLESKASNDHSDLGTSRRETDHSEYISSKTARPDNTPVQVLVLPFTSRTISYATYGPPSQTTLFILHSLPGSRLEASLFASLATEHDVRVIGVDRPGYGMASFDGSRAVRDYATDIQALADHLGIAQFSVLGLSGGGAYALSCALSIEPTRLLATGVYDGIGPVHQTGVLHMGLSLRDKITWALFAHSASLGQWAGRRWLSRKEIQADPAKLSKRLSKRIRRIHDPATKSSYEDQQETIVRSRCEALRQGPEGFFADMGLLAGDWGFKVVDIPKDRRIVLRYSSTNRKDRTKMGRWICSRLGGREVDHLRAGPEGGPVGRGPSTQLRVFRQDLPEFLSDEHRSELFKSIMSIP